MAKKSAKSVEPKKSTKSVEPKKKKPISLNILEIAKKVQKLEETGGGGSADSAKQSDIATEFNTTTAYTAGCYVYHEGKLYQFNADHSAGAWDPTDVVEANVTDQIVSNASAIAGLTASDVAYDNTDSGLTATDVQGAVNELADALDDVTSALDGSNLTDIIDWEENTSYPSGTAVPSGIWTWIGHKILQPGIYYISCVANLSTGSTSTTAVSLLQQIRDLTHNEVLISDSLTATQRSMPSNCIVAITEPTDIYFDVYVGGSASVYARAYKATKIF